jgi:hypothetical protein
LRDESNRITESTINLVYKRRKEKRVIHFVSNEEKAIMAVALEDYRSCEFSLSEWVSIFSYEFPHMKVLDKSSLENFVSSLRK